MPSFSQNTINYTDQIYLMREETIQKAEYQEESLFWSHI